MKFTINADISLTFFKKKFRTILRDHIKSPSPLTPHKNDCNSLFLQVHDDFFNKVIKSCRLSKIGINNIVPKNDKGQYSFQLNEVDPLLLCDNISLFKLILKKMAEGHDLTASFMARPTNQCLGNQMNFKIKFNEINNGKTLEKKFEDNQPVNGVHKYLQDMFVFYAPNVNSYKRLQYRLLI